MHTTLVHFVVVVVVVYTSEVLKDKCIAGEEYNIIWSQELQINYIRGCFDLYHFNKNGLITFLK